MNKAKFFEALRMRNSGVFGTSLSAGQVEGTEALLRAGDGLSVPHMAHVLAEVYHETGHGMLPVKETVFPYSKNKNPSDGTVIARLDSAWKRGKLPWVKTPYWRDGMFGRGQIQITHAYNYRKASAIVGADLVREPWRALALPISAKIAVHGCAAGMFTGKKLSDYDGPHGFDHYNARAIVNGDKRKNGNAIAGYAKAFEAALIAAEWGVNPEPKAPAATGLAALFSAILKLFGGKK
jgi:predicted chitinase